jgi:hypothetical protein
LEIRTLIYDLQHQKQLKDFQVGSCMQTVRKFNHLTTRVFKKEFQIGKVRTLIQSHNTTWRHQIHRNNP